ncbi:hypothetical protein QTP88_004098 [Uroleucon formosanum]
MRERPTFLIRTVFYSRMTLKLEQTKSLQRAISLGNSRAAPTPLRPPLRHTLWKTLDTTVRIPTRRIILRPTLLLSNRSGRGAHLDQKIFGCSINVEDECVEMSASYVREKIETPKVSIKMIISITGT